MSEVQEFRPDAAAYLRAHLKMAVAGGVAAGLVLVAMGDANPWIGPVAALLALGVRGWYLRDEALAAVWRLEVTGRGKGRLLGPGDRSVALAEVARVRVLLGNVQIITRDGSKHLISHLADPAAAVTAIAAAGGGRIGA